MESRTFQFLCSTTLWLLCALMNPILCHGIPINCSLESTNNASLSHVHRVGCTFSKNLYQNKMAVWYFPNCTRIGSCVSDVCPGEIYSLSSTGSTTLYSMNLTTRDKFESEHFTVLISDALEKPVLEVGIHIFRSEVSSGIFLRQKNFSCALKTDDFRVHEKKTRKHRSVRVSSHSSALEKACNSYRYPPTVVGYIFAISGITCAVSICVCCRGWRNKSGKTGQDIHWRSKPDVRINETQESTEIMLPSELTETPAWRQDLLAKTERKIASPQNSTISAESSGDLGQRNTDQQAESQSYDWSVQLQNSTKYGSRPQTSSNVYLQMGDVRKFKSNLSSVNVPTTAQLHVANTQQGNDKSPLRIISTSDDYDTPSSIYEVPVKSPAEEPLYINYTTRPKSMRFPAPLPFNTQ